MASAYSCRQLYPSWKSTKKYLDGIDGELALFPEDCLNWGKDWKIDDIAIYTAERRLTVIGGGHNYQYYVIKNGEIRNYEKDSPPFELDLNGKKITALVRVCALALHSSPDYEEKADLFLVSSALSWSPLELIENNRNNLNSDSLILMSSYTLPELWGADAQGDKAGEIVINSKGAYWQLELRL